MKKKTNQRISCGSNAIVSRSDYYVRSGHCNTRGMDFTTRGGVFDDG